MEAKAGRQRKCMIVWPKADYVLLQPELSWHYISDRFLECSIRKGLHKNVTYDFLINDLAGEDTEASSSHLCDDLIAIQNVTLRHESKMSVVQALPCEVQEAIFRDVFSLTCWSPSAFWEACSSCPQQVQLVLLSCGYQPWSSISICGKLLEITEVTLQTQGSEARR